MHVTADSISPSEDSEEIGSILGKYGVEHELALVSEAEHLMDYAFGEMMRFFKIGSSCSSSLEAICKHLINNTRRLCPSFSHSTCLCDVHKHSVTGSCHAKSSSFEMYHAYLVR